MKPIAIVPARGGSKRIHRKNIKPFLGTPILGRVLGELKASKVFSSIVVSTDDQEISDLSKEYGADIVVQRPHELADDHTGIQDVVKHVLNHQEVRKLEFNEVMCIFPTSVFVTGKILSASLNKFREGNNSSMVSVLEYPHPIQRALVRDSQGHLTLKQPEYAQFRTQDLEKSYYDAAQFYWASREKWLTPESILHGSTPFVLAGWEAMDIDNGVDWIFAEKLFSLEDEKARYFSNNQ
jgi:N-acylneuraminate cytidylyltransferase